MNSQRYFLSLLVLLSVFATAALASEPPKQPNIVLLLADDLGWTGLKCFGSDFYETPYIFRWPGKVPAGTVCHEVISGVDLYPTFLTLAGAAKPSHILDGTNLTPLLVDPQERLGSREIYWYFPSYSAFHRPSVVVRRGEWKLIHLFETGESELYHTGDDIGEAANVAAEHPKLVNELEARVREWMEEANAPRMTTNPEYQPNWRANRS